MAYKDVIMFGGTSMKVVYMGKLEFVAFFESLDPRMFHCTRWQAVNGDQVTDVTRRDRRYRRGFRHYCRIVLTG